MKRRPPQWALARGTDGGSDRVSTGTNLTPPPRWTMGGGPGGGFLARKTAAPVQLICPCVVGRKDLMTKFYPAAVGDTTRTRVREDHK